MVEAGGAAEAPRDAGQGDGKPPLVFAAAGGAHGVAPAISDGLRASALALLDELERTPVEQGVVVARMVGGVRGDMDDVR